MKDEHDNKTVDWAMRANEFIRNLGVEVARHYDTGYNDDFSVELKRLIESHDLSDRLGGIDTLQSELDCDHDWEDISTTADLERQLICTYCGLERLEPLESNAQRWTDGGEP